MTIRPIVLVALAVLGFLVAGRASFARFTHRPRQIRHVPASQR
jgi:hypothetical protein